MDTTLLKKIRNESVDRFKDFASEKLPKNPLDCPGCIYLGRCLYVSVYPCQYNAFALADHVVGRMNAILLIGRCVFWEPLWMKIRHVLRLVYKIIYWTIQVTVSHPEALHEIALRCVNKHRESIVTFWITFITSILVSILAFLVMS